MAHLVLFYNNGKELLCVDNIFTFYCIFLSCGGAHFLFISPRRVEKGSETPPKQ